ncbi:MAG TPA: EAL domain-containing protein [Cellvibrionaceae bacterium]
MRLTYRYKLLLILLAMVMVLVLAIYLATRAVIRDAVTQQAYLDLERGGELFSQLLQDRAGQLAQSVGVLVDDFGFKEAVATADRATIVSALNNHRLRVGADIALVLEPNGELLASSQVINAEGFALLSKALAGSNEINNTRYAPIVLDNRLYQFVFAPVRAPLTVANAGVGFKVDQSLADHLKRLTDLDVSFWRQGAETTSYLAGTLSDNDLALMQSSDWRMPDQDSTWLADEKLNNSVTVTRVPQQVVAVLQVPLEKVMQPFAVLDTQLLTLTFSFLLAAGMLAMFMARSVTRPVRELAGSARKMAEGDYASQVPEHSADELGDLARAFNQMQRAIAVREKEITYQAEHDSLTGLANRAQVFPCMRVAIAAANEQHLKLIVAIADIQKFTQINDGLSSETGDKVLAEVARRLQAISPSTLRLGSDEFLLLIHSVDPPAAIDAIHLAFNNNLGLDAIDVHIDLNVGYAQYPDDGDNADLLLRRANLALSEARLGHIKSCAYQSGWDEKHLRRLHILSAYSTAFESGQMQIYLQPKINPHIKQELGAEVLIRWIHPEMGFISPEEFILVIESAGQISLLTRWVLAQAFAAAAALRDEGVELILSVNLSVLDLLEDDLPEYINALTMQYDLSAQSIYLEVTESAIMREADRSLATLRALDAMGFKLSIDDYGTGFSSLSQLKKLPVHELKIDKSFVMNLDADKDDQQIVKSTIELGHTLGLSITAEGVETANTRDWLIANGCDILQGYFYSKPLPLDAFSLWAKKYLTGDIDA